MAIIVKDSFEPLSERSLRPNVEAPLLVESEATRVLGQELLRYCEGDVTGRSFLIAGHRGAGKTTLVAKAFLDVWRKVDRGQQMLRPLLIPLHGPSLFPSPEVAPRTDGHPAAGEGTNTDRGSTQTAKAEPAAPVKPPGDTDAKPDKVDVKSRKEAHSKPDAQVALEQITLGLHRAVTREFAKRYYDRAGDLAHLRRRGLDPTSPAEVADDFDRLMRAVAPDCEIYQIAAQFETELYEAPSAQRLLEFYRYVDGTAGGILFQAGHASIVGSIGRDRPIALRPDELWAHEQGARELVALASVVEAYRRISGEYTRSDSLKDQLSQQRQQTFSGGGDLKNIVAPIAALLTGSLTGTGLAVSGASAPGAVIGGIATALASSLVFKVSTERKRDRTVTRDYQFVFDLSVATLDRILPILIERLRVAGLAPVFVVDELDKVRGLGTRMLSMVHHLKKLVAENAFFCFLTDRSYYEEMTATIAQRPYSVEYTYFGQRLFVVFSPEDFERYLRERIPDPVEPPTLGSSATSSQGPADPVLTAERTARAIVLWGLRHRSQLHVMDLQREITTLRDDTGRITVEPDLLASSVRNRVDASFQVGIELRLAHPELQQLSNERPEFRRLLNDAMYYPTRRWLEGRDGVDLTWETGFKEFVSYLEQRAARDDQPAPERNAQQQPVDSAPPKTVARPFSDRESEFLFDQVRELADFLSDRPSPDTSPSGSSAAGLAASPGDWRREQINTWNQGRAQRKLPPLEATVSNILLVGQKSSILTRDSSKSGVYTFGYRIGRSRPAQLAEAVPPAPTASPAVTPPAPPVAVSATVTKVEPAESGPGPGSQSPSLPIAQTPAGSMTERSPQDSPEEWPAQAAFIRRFAQAVQEMQVEPMVAASSSIKLHGPEMLSLASLQTPLCLLPQTPSSAIVEKALSRLEDATKRGTTHSTYADDVFHVEKFYDLLSRNAGVVGGAMVCATIVALPSSTIETHKKIQRGLEIMSQAYGFETRDEADVRIALENLMAQIRSEFGDIVDISLLGHEIRSAEELEEFTRSVRNAALQARNAADRKVAALKYVETAWLEVQQRLLRWIDTGAPGDPEIAELLASAAARGPSRIMPFDPRRMSAADWTRLLVSTRANLLTPDAKGTGEPLPAWMGIFAVRALGFDSEVQWERLFTWLGIDAQTSDPPTRIAIDRVHTRFPFGSAPSSAVLVAIRRTATQLFAGLPPRISSPDITVSALVATAEEMRVLLTKSPGETQPLPWMNPPVRKVLALEMEPESEKTVEQIASGLYAVMPMFKTVFAYADDRGRTMKSPHAVRPRSAEELVQAAGV